MCQKISPVNVRGSEVTLYPGQNQEASVGVSGKRRMDGGWGRVKKISSRSRGVVSREQPARADGRQCVVVVSEEGKVPAAVWGERLPF